MRIKVDKFYQDVSGNKVNVGEYDASELKNDLANYLVKHGHAVYIGGAIESDTEMVIDNNNYQVGIDTGIGDDKTVETDAVKPYVTYLGAVAYVFEPF